MRIEKTNRLIPVALTLLLAIPVLALAACGDDSAAGNNNDVSNNNNDNVNDNTNNNTNNNNNNQVTEVCLLNMCETDAHCALCTEGRNTCLVAENRCVACDPTAGTGCDTGEVCSSYGICVPEGLTCPTNTEGDPTVVCVANADCFACSPMHQVCDTTTHKCQACTATNTSHCLPSDICVDGQCSPECPAKCTVDNDCQYCPQKACNQHKCSECSDTYPCPAGMECLSGVCIWPCGLPGPVAGICEEDLDCQWCGEGDATGIWDCHFPIGGSAHGTCTPPAAGCSDLGTNVVVLPDPWNDYTETCSNDGDCVQADAGPDINLGAMVRDQLGLTEIDIFGLATITIGDATVKYPMKRCAAIELTESLSCGICVPCKVDTDCAPIAIDPFLDDLFIGSGLSEFIIDLALNMIWGDNPPELNFFCQPIAAGYGACIPCSNPFSACGTTSGGGGSGTCDHDVCTAGGPLDTSCGDCAEAVCNADSYCCTDDWDSICVGLVDDYCATPCGGSTTTCSPDICTDDTLDAQSALCNPCTEAICAEDPYCCNTASGAWDDECVASTATEADCTSICAGGCSHDECDTGGALESSCSACAAAVCVGDDFCCDIEWDSLCVEAAEDDDVNCTCP